MDRSQWLLTIHFGNYQFKVRNNIATNRLLTRTMRNEIHNDTVPYAIN